MYLHWTYFYLYYDLHLTLDYIIILHLWCFICSGYNASVNVNPQGPPRGYPGDSDRQFGTHPEDSDIVHFLHTGDSDNGYFYPGDIWQFSGMISCFFLFKNRWFYPAFCPFLYPHYSKILRKYRCPLFSLQGLKLLFHLSKIRFGYLTKAQLLCQHYSTLPQHTNAPVS